MRERKLNAERGLLRAYLLTARLTVPKTRHFQTYSRNTLVPQFQGCTE
jgi:hypothetical protein